MLTIANRRSIISGKGKSRNFIWEVIVMGLRKVAGAIALLGLFSLMGGGGNRYPCPDDAMGLFRLASLCPFRPGYGDFGVPGGEPGQDSLLRH